MWKISENGGGRKEKTNTSNLKIIYLWNEHNKYGIFVLLLFHEIKRTMYLV